MSLRGLYASGSDIITITTEDCTGRKNGKERANAQDEESVAKLFKMIIDKYSLNLKIVREERKSDDLDWLKADENFRF